MLAKKLNSFLPFNDFSVAKYQFSSKMKKRNGKNVVFSAYGGCCYKTYC
jgi:hypothetical protein